MSSLARLVFAFAAAALSCGETAEPVRPRVAVIGIDGGSWSVIDPMFADGDLPTLRRLADVGIRGTLESEPPMASPVVWTTMFTGVSPHAHGVDSWSRAAQWHRRAAAIWDVTRALGRSTHVLNVPGTWPAEPILGVMVSGFPFPSPAFGDVDGAAVDLNDLANGRVRPVYHAIAPEIRSALDRLVPGEWTDWISVAKADGNGVLRARLVDEDTAYLSPVYRLRHEPSMTYPPALQDSLRGRGGAPYVAEGPRWRQFERPHATTVLREHFTDIHRGQVALADRTIREPWELFVFVMTLTDRVSHVYWPFHEPEAFPGLDPDAINRYGNTVAEAYRDVDARLGELVDTLPEDVYVLVLSDHGFQSSSLPEDRSGRHHADGIFLLTGPDLERGHIGRIDLIDVAPTILHLLKIPASTNMHGTVPDLVRSRTGERLDAVPTYPRGSIIAGDERADERIREHLRGLGYMSAGSSR